MLFRFREYKFFHLSHGYWFSFCFSLGARNDFSTISHHTLVNSWNAEKLPRFRIFCDRKLRGFFTNDVAAICAILLARFARGNIPIRLPHLNLLGRIILNFLGSLVLNALKDNFSSPWLRIYLVRSYLRYVSLSRISNFFLWCFNRKLFFVRRVKIVMRCALLAWLLAADINWLCSSTRWSLGEIISYALRLTV